MDFIQNLFFCGRRLPIIALVGVLVVLPGCKSTQDKALEQAEKQAATTGQAQQVVSVDKNGITTTTVVQPPVAGQKAAVITTTTTPPTVGAPIQPFSGPAVSVVPPPKPVSANIPAGTTLAIRTDQRISVKTNRTGDRFTGEMMDPIRAEDKSVLIPKGARVEGIVDMSHRRGHFKGRSFLELRLTSLSLNGTHYSLATRDVTRTKKGKGKRSAALIAGGSGLGMLVGGLASGGMGVAVGGLVGGGAGTAAAGLTGNRDIEIPAESIVHFTLSNDLIVRLAP